MDGFVKLVYIILLCIYYTDAISNDYILQRFDNMEKKIHHLEKEMYQLKRDNIELTKENKNILQMVSACEERLMYNDDETTVLYENEKQQSKSDNTYDDDVRPYIDGTEDRSSLNTDTTEEVSHNADNDTGDKHSKRLLLSSPQVPNLEKIAFAASLTNTIKSLGSHQVIDFNQVITNIGNAYDARLGHFTAPIKGIYLFSMSAHAIVNQVIVLDLVRNGNRIIDVFADARGGAEEAATQTLPLVLEKGDMVWVRTHERYTGYTLYGSTEWNRSSFSGVLLFSLP